jgi:Ras-related protein Rab-1A
MSSIGVDFKSKQIEVDDKLIKMQIWDTAGHEKFRTITTSYYKSAHAIIILYDITEQTSFDHINNWMIEIDKFAKQGVLRIIVGNKKDLESKRQVSTKDAESLADKYGIKFMEVSAKDNTNIEALFLDIVKRLLENYLKSKGDIINTPSTNNVVLKKDKNLNKKKKCC